MRFNPAGCSPALADTHRKQMDSVLVSVGHGHGHEGPRSGLQPSTLMTRLMWQGDDDTECSFHAISRNAEAC